MLINLFGELYGPEVIAAFSGAMLFIATQRIFTGINKLLVFLVSFFMGILGGEMTVTLVQRYLPEGIHLGREAGAFICSVLIVSVSMLVISQVERRLGHHS